jgi:hypothetical protein
MSGDRSIGPSGGDDSREAGSPLHRHEGAPSIAPQPDVRPISPAPSTPAAPVYPPPPGPPSPGRVGGGPNPIGAPPTGPPMGGPPPGVPLQGPPPGPPGVPPAPRATRGRGLIVGIIVVLAAVLTFGAGFWAVRSFLMNGGSDSPEAAAESLIAALVAQDPVAAGSVMNPAEVRELPALITEAVDKSREVGVSTGDSIVPGLRVQVDDYRLEVDEEGDGVARVTVRDPRFRVSFNGADLASSDSRLRTEEDLVDTDASIDQDDMGEDVEDTGLMLMVVDDGDGWYVSPGMTALEYAWQLGAFGSGGEPDYDAYRDEVDSVDGSPEPVDVPLDVASAVSDGDIEAVIEAMPSDQFRIMNVYGRLVRDWLQSELDQSSFSPGDFELEDVELIEQDAGSARRLVATSVEYRDGGEDVDEDYGDPERAAGRNGCVPLIEARLGGCVSAGSLLGRLLAQADLDRPSVIVREVDGGWKLDPVATIVDWGRRAVAVITPDVVSAALESTSGEVHALAQPDSPAKVSLGDRGFAVVELGTSPGSDYVLGVTFDESADDVGNIRVTTPSGDSLDVEWLGADHLSFRAEGPTRLFIGGLESDIEEVTVALALATPGEAQLVAGLVTTLSAQLPPSGVALWRAVVPPGVQSVGATSESDADLSIFRSTPNALLGEEVYSSDTLTAGETVILAVTGPPGSSVDVPVIASYKGFSDGASARQVQLPSGTSQSLQLSLGASSSSTSVRIAVTGGGWYASIRSEDDYDSVSSSSGSNGGSGVLEVYDSGPARIDLSCSGSSFVPTTCIFDLVVE